MATNIMSGLYGIVLASSRYMHLSEINIAVQIPTACCWDDIEVCCFLYLSLNILFQAGKLPLSSTLLLLLFLSSWSVLILLFFISQGYLSYFISAFHPPRRLSHVGKSDSLFSHERERFLSACLCVCVRAFSVAFLFFSFYVRKEGRKEVYFFSRTVCLVFCFLLGLLSIPTRNFSRSLFFLTSGKK